MIYFVDVFIFYLQNKSFLKRQPEITIKNRALPSRL